MTPQQANTILLQSSQTQPPQSQPEQQQQQRQQQQTVDEFHATEIKDSQTVQEFHDKKKKDNPSLNDSVSTGSSSDSNELYNNDSTTNRTDTQNTTLSNTTNTTTWYQILESTNTGTNTNNNNKQQEQQKPPNVIALYLNKNDAEFGLSIYEELALRKYNHQQEQIQKINNDFTTNLSTPESITSTTPTMIVLPTYTIQAIEKE
jgi:hypothetical protein